jgi:hypothetical protein
VEIEARPERVRKSSKISDRKNSSNTIQDLEGVGAGTRGDFQGTSTIDPVQQIAQEMQQLGIAPNTQGLQGGLFRTEKPQTVDLDVIRDWIDENKVKFTTRLMQPFHMTILENITIELGKNFDESAMVYTKKMDENGNPELNEKGNPVYVSTYKPVHYSAAFCKNMYEVYKVDMIPFEGKRVLEQTEGLRARKDTEVKGSMDGKSMKNFLIGDKSTT